MCSLPEDLKLKAQQALTKLAKYGPDFDPSIFITEQKTEDKSTDLEKRIREASLMSGFDPEEKNRSASYFQKNDHTLYEKVSKIYHNQVEIMSIEEALTKYDWLSNYWWKAVPVDMDKYTAYTELHQKGGYFIRIFAGAKIEQPIQSCLLLSENNGSQRVHNIIIAEENSQAEIISGCTTIPKVENGMHLGISEFFLQKGASLSFTMIHNWAENFHVRPRSGAIVEEKASFINNYILLKPVKSLQSNPRAILQGKGAKARFNSIIYGCKDAILDLGSVIELNAPDTRAEAISRAAAGENSQIMMRGNLMAKDNSAQARLECKGMLLSATAKMQALPGLDVDGAPLANLTHEAAVGPVNKEAIEYLMTRGLSEEEATSLIIQGFMKVGISGLPEMLDKMVDDMSKTISNAGL